MYIKGHIDFNLGNFLFQLASSVSLDLDNDPIYIPYSCDAHVAYDSYHSMYPRVTAISKLPDLPLLNESALCGDFCATDCCKMILEGYYQDATLINKTRLDGFIQEPASSMQIFASKYGDVWARGDEVVGVNVKRGNYLSDTFPHAFVGENYLKEAVASFSTYAIFLVCSDDIEWCRRFFNINLFGSRKFIFVEGISPITQLFALSHCDHNIMANSSFSWWSAYLNKNPRKKVIMPSEWYRFTVVDRTAKGLYWDGVEIIRSERM